MAISLLAYLPIQVEAAEYISGFPLPSGKVYNINCLAEYTVPYYDGSTYRYEHWVSLYHWKWGPLYGTTEDRYAVADIGAANGTKIFSVAEGRVWKTGYDSESGNWVIIHHSDGTYAYYGHMAAASKYKAGDSVSAGTQLGNVSAGHLHFEWSGHDPGCEYLNKGLVKLASAAKEKPHVHGTQSVSFEFYSNSSAGTTSDTWLYPAFKVTVPNYQNSKITTVGYYAYTASGDEMFRFQETYKSGVLKDGTSNKHTYFGARTDGGASLDASSDVTDVSRVYYIENLKFTSGHTYKVKGFVVFDGKRYESSEYTMSTTGSKQCTWDGGSVTKQPTCTATGVKTYTCRTCGVTKTESIAAKGHTPGAAATCTSPQKCTDCGTQLKAALGHNFSGSYYFSTHPHEEYQKCTRCNAGKKTGNTKKVDGCSICYPIVTFTITYNANGGTGAPSPQTKESGKALKLSSTEPTRQGYTFLGWATSSGASSAQYNAGSSFTVDANTTLYAVWRKDATPTDAQLVVGSVTGSKGKIVEIPVVINNNPGINVLTVTPVYDKSAMKLVSLKCTDSRFTIVSGTNNIVFTSSQNITTDGTFFTMTFEIFDNAQDGIYDVSLTFRNAAGKINNNDAVERQLESVPGKVRVNSITYGDVNGDGKITAVDLSLLCVYIANYDYDTNTSTVSVQAGADVNGDGNISAVDLSMLCVYIANYDYDSNKSTIVLGPKN